MAAHGAGERFTGPLVGLLVLLAATLAVGVPGTAQAAAVPSSSAGVSFVDDRPAFVDLDGSDRLWEVDVVNIGSAPALVSLQVIDAGGVLQVAGSGTQTVPAGATGGFHVLELPDSTTASSLPSTGELLLIASDGSLQRRALTLQHGKSSVPPPSELTFSGWLLAPLFGRVELPTVAAAKYLDGQAPGTLGVVDSTVGRQGFVVDDGTRVRVIGVHDAGSYSGTAVLAPATTTKIDVSVRDTPLWPAMALIVGLAVVSRLDDYSKRSAPRRQLQIRLLRRKADIEKCQQEGATKVVGALGPRAEPALPALVSVPGDSRTLVYEKISEEALRAFDTGDQDVRDEWLSTGKAWETTDSGLSKCCSFLESVGELADRFLALQERAGGAEAVALTRSLLSVREALQPGAIASLDVLAVAAADVSAALVTIESFDRALTLLELVGQRGGDEHALHILGVRLLAGDDIAEVCDDAGKLMNAVAQQAAAAAADKGLTTVWPEGGPVIGQPEPVGALPPPVGEMQPGAAAPPVGAPQPVQPGRLHPRRALLRWPAAGAATAVLVIALAVTLLTLGGGSGRSAPPGGASATTTTVELPFTGPPPPLPVEPQVVPPVAAGGSKYVTAAAWVMQAGVMPLIIGLPVALVLWLVLTKWFGRRSTNSLGGLEAEDRRTHRRFLLLSGVIVLTSGLAVLYVPNSHWGSLGDFLTALLWGTGTTAGLSVVRRFVPST